MNRKYFGMAILGIIFFYLLVVQIKAIWFFTIDDMFIPLRYARNWVEGQGLLWNTNELPVEGYSNFSFVLIAASAIKLGLNPVVVLKLLGVIGLYLTVWGIYLLSRLWFVVWVACLPCIALLLYKGQIIWSVSGLETTIYQASLAFALYFLLRGQGYSPYPSAKTEVKTGCHLLSALCLLLASITRPEGVFFLVLFFALAIVDSDKSQRRSVVTSVFKATVLFAVFYVPYFFWRWYYFGHLLPNPVLCKGFSADNLLSLDFTYLRLAWPFALLSIVAVMKAQDRRHYFFWTPSLLYLLLLAKADPIVAFENRLFLPAFQFLLPLAVLGLSGVTDYFAEEKEGKIFAICAFLTGFFFLPVMSVAEYQFFSINPQAGLRLRQNVLSWMAAHVPENSRVVLADSGMIPYYSKANFIDSSCLSNRQMTQQPDAGMYLRFCEQILKDKPEIIILSQLLERNQKIVTPADSCLETKLADSTEYKLKAIFETGDTHSTYRYSVYAKNGALNSDNLS